MNRIFAKSVTFFMVCCLCMSFFAAGSFAYADEPEYVGAYDENQDGAVSYSYWDEKILYRGFLNPENDALNYEVYVTMQFEYADNSWVEVKDATLRINCYNDYKVAVSPEKKFGKGDCSRDYCRRIFTILTPNELHIEYYLYAEADCFGDVYLTCYVNRIY